MPYVYSIVKIQKQDVAYTSCLHPCSTLSGPSLIRDVKPWYMTGAMTLERVGQARPTELYDYQYRLGRPMIEKSYGEAGNHRILFTGA
jgi:hypothetical protein